MPNLSRRVMGNNTSCTPRQRLHSTCLQTEEKKRFRSEIKKPKERSIIIKKLYFMRIVDSVIISICNPPLMKKAVFVSDQKKYIKDLAHTTLYCGYYIRTITPTTSLRKRSRKGGLIIYFLPRIDRVMIAFFTVVYS